MWDTSGAIFVPSTHGAAVQGDFGGMLMGARGESWKVDWIY